MISPCLFLDIDTQKIFFEGNKKMWNAIGLKKNFKKLTLHALKKKIPMVSFLETKRDASGHLQKKKETVHQKISETAVKKNCTVASEEPAKNYGTLLKKFSQICVEKTDFNIFNNKQTLKLLKASGIKNCVVYGGGLDYGLHLAVSKLLKSNFQVWIPVDATWCINEINRERALKELREMGAHMWNTDFIILST